MVEIEQIFQMKAAEAQARIAKLTPRREVAALLAIGTSNHEVAEHFRLSPKTVDIHRAKIKQKLQTTVQGISRVWFLATLAERHK